jgi:hypothetical protein
MGLLSTFLAAFIGSFCGAYCAIWQERRRAATAIARAPLSDSLR